MFKKQKIFSVLLIVILTLVMVVSFAACDKKEGHEPATVPVAPAKEADTVPEYTASVNYTDAGLEILPGKDRPVYLAKVRGVVIDDDTKEPIIAQLKIWDRLDNKIYRTVTDILGRYELLLPDGNYNIEFSHGSEYEIETLRDYSVYMKGDFIMPAISLKRLYTLDDWYAGDPHQHSEYSVDGSGLPSRILKSNIAMGCSWGMLSDHNCVYQIPEWMAGKNVYVGGGKYFIPIPGWEVTTARGHYQAINCPDIFNGTAYSAPDVTRVVKDIRLQGNTIAGINHPGRNDEMGFKDWNLVKYFDTVEIWNGAYAPPQLGGVNKVGYEKWIELMNRGVRKPVLGGTDNHVMNGDPYEPDGPAMDWVKRGKYSAMPRNYLHLEEYSIEGILDAIRAGHCFITNGPLVFADIDGVSYGDTVEPRENLTLNYDLKSNEPLTSMKILVNGKIVKTVQIDPDTIAVQGTYELTSMKAGDWVQLQIYGVNGGLAITNPIMIGSYQE